MHYSVNMRWTIVQLQTIYLKHNLTGLSKGSRSS